LHIECIPVLINGPPEVVQFASDADKHLIEKPLVSGFRSAPLERVGVGAPKTQAPLADDLIADHDPSGREDQLDLSKAQAEAVIQPDRLVDDVSWKAEATVRVRRRAHA
jgi:hypothetical protein